MNHELDNIESLTEGIKAHKVFFDEVTGPQFDHLYTEVHQMACKLKRLQAVKKTLKEFDTLLTKVVDHIRIKKLPDVMRNEGVEKVTFAGIGRLSLTNDMHVSINPLVKRSALMWLQDHGFADLVKETVHAQSLKALAKEQFDNGTALPEDMFNVAPYTRAAITAT